MFLENQVSFFLGLTRLDLSETEKLHIARLLKNHVIGSPHTKSICAETGLMGCVIRCVEEERSDLVLQQLCVILGSLALSQLYQPVLESGVTTHLFAILKRTDNSKTQEAASWALKQIVLNINSDPQQLKFVRSNKELNQLPEVLKRCDSVKVFENLIHVISSLTSSWNLVASSASPYISKFPDDQKFILPGRFVPGVCPNSNPPGEAEETRILQGDDCFMRDSAVDEKSENPHSTLLGVSCVSPFLVSSSGVSADVGFLPDFPISSRQTLLQLQSITEIQQKFHDHGILLFLLEKLHSSTSEKLRRACLSAITNMCLLNATNSSVVLSHPFRENIAEYLSSVSADLAIQAAICLSVAIRGSLQEFSTSKEAPFILKIIIKGIKDGCNQRSGKTLECAAFALTYLLAEDESLLEKGTSQDIISILMDKLQQLSYSSSPSQIQQITASLSLICSIIAKKKSGRSQVAKPANLEKILRLLDHPSHQVRSASCTILRNLSRSVRHLRTSLTDANIAPLIFQALKEENEVEVKYTCLCTLCNLCLEFSPMKQTLITSGIIPYLIDLLDNSLMEDRLRLMVTWLLSNISYQASPELKEEVLNAIGVDQMISMVLHSESEIRTKALNLLGNLLCNTKFSLDNIPLLQKLLTAVLQVIKEARCHHVASVIKQGLHVCNNISVLASAECLLYHHPSFQTVCELMGYQGSEKIRTFPSEEVEEVRMAAVMIIFNLSWPSDPSFQRAVSTRIIKISSAMSELKLKERKKAVKERMDACVIHLDQLSRSMCLFY